MKLNELLKQPEGRRLEFKEKFPKKADLCTNALLLISDDPLKHQFFPYAKIECARFKGTQQELEKYLWGAEKKRNL
ncbi:MAG: hypothetical protein OMM_06795 [Candidatus Magnetoglobus multicellularis str. Araruama]|uniref:Uncharacterized protein n=1 Tax=Candidatus Magnetoglobus multicellularis str. Araruama TaxID=890399 RepID=A0A1V1PG75_9BACT|nr:MAG: hypothetical protein OMM_06795 [Candidatus Magnetoglobus multicellularis str. Araruama]